MYITLGGLLLGPDEKVHQSALQIYIMAEGDTSSNIRWRHKYQIEVRHGSLVAAAADQLGSERNTHIS